MAAHTHETYDNAFSMACSKTSDLTAAALVEEGRRLLCAGGVHNGQQEARWILDHVLTTGRDSRGRSGCNMRVGAGNVLRFRELLQRRQGGEPLQYLLHSTEFYGLELAVGPGVLIPRPETERLVEIALEAFPGRGRICDLCTGSGAIALALAHECGAAASVTGVDISDRALTYARLNAERLGIATAFLRGDLFTPFPGSCRFALVTANPPYVSADDYASLATEIRYHEPREALWAGPDGLDVISSLVARAPGWLLPGASLVVEIGAEQGGRVKALFERVGLEDVRVHQDYAGRDRVVIGRCGGA